MKIHLSKKHNVRGLVACALRFDSRKDLIKHWILTSHYYYCYVCDGGYQSRDQFATHTCTPRKDAVFDGIKCLVCGMMAPSQAAYDNHWEDTAGDPRHLRCNQCHKEVIDENALRQHMQLHRPATIVCFHCNKRFCSHSDIFRHMEVSCPYINRADIHGRLLHMLPDHSCAFPLSMTQPERYFCRDYYRKFDDLGSLTAHMEQSDSCPGDVRSEYFKNIIANVNSHDWRFVKAVHVYDEDWSDQR